MPKVSICIPTYNQTTYLTKTLESVAAQTFQDFEIIITDDSTTNEVEDLVRTFQDIWGAKLIYQRNRPSLGSPENWNEAIRLSNGDLIKILHHDEWFTDGHSLQSFVTAIDANSQAQFAICQAITVHATSKKEWIHTSPIAWRNKITSSPPCIQLANLIGSPSNLILRKSAVELFDKNLKWLVDVDFYIRLFLKYKSPVWIDSPLVTSVTGASHNVTNDCIDDAQIQIFEHVYTYVQYNNNLTLFQKARYLFHFVQLFRRFRVTHEEDIVRYGYKKTLPTLIKRALFVAQIFKKK